jgi:hypothetical protein
MNFRVCLPFLFSSFALSPSLGEMGVLIMLSESGEHGFTTLCFLFNESCPSEVPVFGQQSLPTVTQ